MATQVPDLLPPTRLTGNQQVDQQATLDYLWNNYRALVVALNAVSSLGTLATQDASDVSITGGTIAVPTTGSELVANKDAASGYAGLSASYQVHFQNATGTFKSTLSNANTAARDYVFPNTSGTVALTSDLSGFESTSNKDAASGYAGLSSTYQIKLKNAAGTVINTLSSSATSARDYIFPDASGTMVTTAGAAFTGRIDQTAGTSIAAAATTVLTGATSNTVHITGVGPTSAITMNQGHMTLIPDAAWQLVNHATNCKIIWGADYTCTAGEPVEVFYDGTTVFVFPQVPRGRVLQVVSATYATSVSNSTNSYTSSGLVGRITPTRADSKILVLANLAGGQKSTSDTGIAARVLRDSTVGYCMSAGALGVGGSTTFHYGAPITGVWLDSPATVSEVVYDVQFSSISNTAAVAVQFPIAAAQPVSSIILMEIAA